MLLLDCKKRSNKRGRTARRIKTGSLTQEGSRDCGRRVKNIMEGVNKMCIGIEWYILDGDEKPETKTEGITEEELLKIGF